MNDYISREDALKLAHDIVVPQKSGGEYRHRCIDPQEIIELPSADVEEVIRCKECKHFNLNKWGKVNDVPLIVAHEICDFWGEGCKTDKDAYCSFAERRG